MRYCILDSHQFSQDLLEDSNDELFTQELVDQLLELVVEQLQEHETRFDSCRRDLSLIPHKCIDSVLERLATRQSDEDYDHEVEANLTDQEQQEFSLISQVRVVHNVQSSPLSAF